MAMARLNEWILLAYRHAASHPWAALSLMVPVAITAGLLCQSIVQILSGQADGSLGLAVMAGMGGFIATALGALPVLALRSIPVKIEDIMIGFAAGI